MDILCTHYQHLPVNQKKVLPSLWAWPRKSFGIPMGTEVINITKLLSMIHIHLVFPNFLQETEISVTVWGPVCHTYYPPVCRKRKSTDSPHPQQITLMTFCLVSGLVQQMIMNLTLWSPNESSLLSFVSQWEKWHRSKRYSSGKSMKPQGAQNWNHLVIWCEGKTLWTILICITG